MDVRQHVDRGRHVVPAQLEASLEVLHRVGLRVSELEDFERKSIRVAGDEDDDDRRQRHSRLFATSLQTSRLNSTRQFFIDYRYRLNIKPDNFFRNFDFRRFDDRRFDSLFVDFFAFDGAERCFDDVDFSNLI